MPRTRRIPSIPSIPNSKDPQKIKKGFNKLIISPCANGYWIQSPESGTKLWVFPTIELAFDFIKEHLEPTDEQREFIEKI